MAIRIIAGSLGGRILKTPRSHKTHPMGERERAAIFNAISHDLANAKILDLFAGSGALGLESLSRGGRLAVFVEKDHLAQKILAENIAALGVRPQTILHNMNARNIFNLGEKFDIIFADPPYHQPQWNIIQKLGQILAKGGKLIISRQKGMPLPELSGLVVTSSKIYAGAAIDILEGINEF
ncbi:MAG: 16S rRNA (guanine(966)-N(2))-methyltransferase RsmD [Candidatus Nomurabacteria bacterium]|jgi:16S rRNA (guanine966-N2)-methyltransferase|nr:16S rRNA (guanine(966)-N(2))-methyltransferase RsmD [Candidatus Nomurabacteria bacterium]